MMDIEKLSDEELDVIHEKYTEIRAGCVDEEGEANPKITRPSDSPE
jgi:hypothetical protein